MPGGLAASPRIELVLVGNDWRLTRSPPFLALHHCLLLNDTDGSRIVTFIAPRTGLMPEDLASNGMDSYPVPRIGLHTAEQASGRVALLRCSEQRTATGKYHLRINGQLPYSEHLTTFVCKRLVVDIAK